MTAVTIRHDSSGRGVFRCLTVTVLCVGSWIGGAGCRGDATQIGDRLFLGTTAGQNSSGTITIVVHPDDVGTSTSVDAKITTTASGGAPVSKLLTGTEEADVVSLSGNGWNLSGGLDGDSVSGEYTGPGGDSGFFSANDATNTDVTRFCGRFAGDDGGTWNLQLSKAAAGAFAGSLASGTLRGSISGNMITLTFTGDIASGKATGSVGGISVTGIWSTSDHSYSGTWSGSEAACGTSTVKNALACCMQTARGLACPIEGC